MSTCKVCGDILDGNGHESKTGGLVCHVCIRDERIASLRAELAETKHELAVRDEALKVLAETSIRSNRKINHCAGYIHDRVDAALTEARKRLEGKNAEHPHR